MIINRSTTIKSLLDAKQEEVIAVLSSLNKNFERLNSPLLRKLLAARISIEQACKVGGCSLPDFFKAMERIGFKTAESVSPTSAGNNETAPFDCLEPACTLDVRADLAAGKDPLKKIMYAISDIKPGECLKLINTFEPLPLIDLLGKKGYSHFVRREAPELVITYFKKTGLKENSACAPDPELSETASFEQKKASFGDRVVELDVRNLDMPQPMVRILESCENLRDGQAIFVNHKKIPLYLLPHLQDRGFSCLIHELAEDDVKLLIFKQ